MSTTATPPPASAAPALLTAEEFVRLYSDRRAELVRGHVVEMPMPGFDHGKVTNWAAYYLTQHAVANDLGHVVTNDTTVVTERNPDTGRGADVLFVRYEKVPKGTRIAGPLTVPPDLVFEVRSSSDRWTAVVAKALEYLNAGVLAVVILDPGTESATVYRADMRSEIYEKYGTLTLPDVLPGFAVPVARFFE